jgi:hypothetical protein
MNDKTAMELMEDHANALTAQRDALVAELAGVRIERQHEHDLRVRLGGDVEALEARNASLIAELAHYTAAPGLQMETKVKRPCRCGHGRGVHLLMPEDGTPCGAKGCTCEKYEYAESPPKIKGNET